MIVSLFMLSLFLGETLTRIEVVPLDFQHDEKPQTHLKGIQGLSTNGDDLFLLDMYEPGVLQIKANGDFVRRIGGKGKGPGELGYHGSYAFSVHGESVWIRGDNGFLNYYERGEFVIGFKPQPTQISPIRASFSFAFDENVVVYQAFPGTGRLAHLYDYGGTNTGGIGKVMPIEDQFLRVNPALNNTMWSQDDTYFYCLFLFRPVLRIFDKKSHKLVKELIISGPEVEMFEESYFEAKKSTRFTYPLPHFTDFQVHNGDLFLLCDGFLYHLNDKTGELKSRSLIWGKPELTGYDGPKLFFPYFAITKGGEVFLAADGLDFHHDGIWRAKINPSFFGK